MSDENVSPDSPSGRELADSEQIAANAKKANPTAGQEEPDAGSQEDAQTEQESSEQESSSLEEQALAAQMKLQKAQAAVSSVSNGAAALINPVTGIVLLIVLALIGAMLFVMAISTTLGKNSNACKNGEDCSVSEAIANGCDSVTASIEGGDNIEKAYNYMVSNGFTAAGAAGIAGNFQAESGAVPWIAEYGYPPASGSQYVVGGDSNGPRGWGIGQWSFGRHIELKRHVEEGIGPEYYVSQYTDGTPPMDRVAEDTLLASQLDFLMNGEPAEKENLLAVKNASSPEEAARLFHDEWERSAGWNAIRATYARKIFDKLGGNAGGTVATTCTDQGTGPVGDLCGSTPTPYTGATPGTPPSIKPQMTHTKDELLRLCSGAMPTSQSCPADTVNRTPSSGHYWGVSCDIFPAGATGGANACAQPSSAPCANGNSIAAWLVKYHSELKVEYVIWDAKIWSASAGWGPRPYGGCGPTVCNSSPTALHQDHVHVSMIPGP